MEAPRWHDNRIWFSDFYAHEVVSANEDGTDVRVEAVVPNQPSGLGWLPDGRLLVVSMRDRKLLRREHDGALVTHADLSGEVDYHLNDMVVDQQGRAYVGNFGFDSWAGRQCNRRRSIGSIPTGRLDPWQRTCGSQTGVLSPVPESYSSAKQWLTGSPRSTSRPA